MLPMVKMAYNDNPRIRLKQSFIISSYTSQRAVTRMTSLATARLQVVLCPPVRLSRWGA